MKIAIIDIGTNSLKLKLFSLEDNNVPHALHEVREIIQLGEHAYISGKISAPKETLLLTVLTRFKQIAETWQVQKIHAFGTSILREAINGPMIIETIKNKLGIDIEIISGEEEAHYIYLAVKNECQLPPKEPVLIIDIGGGSAECIIANSNQVLDCVSLPLGALRLHDIFVHHNKMSAAELMLLESYIQRAISPFLSQVAHRPIHKVIFTGGTATALLKIGKDMAKENTQKSSVKKTFKGSAKNSFKKGEKGPKGAKGTKESARVAATGLHRGNNKAQTVFLPSIKLKELVACLATTNELNPVEHSQKYKIDIGRSRILLPGLMVIKVALQLLNKNLAYVARSGLRDGLFQSLLKPNETEDNDDWERFVETLLRKYHCDLSHSHQVSRLALALFDQMQVLHELGASERKLLHLAGLLHDIGQFINYTAHHKHSFYILNNINILGISARDRHLIAHISRYHRKSLPSMRHPEFAELPSEDAILVKKLSAILRVADALDRSHNALVKHLKVVIDDKHLELEVDVGDRDFSLEEWAVAKKVDLMKQVFKKDIKIVKTGFLSL